MASNSKFLAELLDSNGDVNTDNLDNLSNTLGTASTNDTSDFLQVSNNLSDLTNADVALDNLGFSSFSKTLIDDADATTVRNTLGLSEVATLNVTGVATDGYVLTADGAGGAAWEAASGGGGISSGVLLYEDNLQVGNSATPTLAANVSITGLESGSSYMFFIGATWGLTGDSSSGSSRICILQIYEGPDNTGTKIFEGGTSTVVEPEETSLNYITVPRIITTSSTTQNISFYISVPSAGSAATYMFFNRSGYIGSVTGHNFISWIKVN